MRKDRVWSLHCIECGQVYEAEPSSFACRRCGNLLELSLVRGGPRLHELTSGSNYLEVWRYSAAIPFKRTSSRVSLGEGGTPLVRSTRLGEELGLANLYLKNEGQNPTGSFKDRGMTVAVSRAKHLGARVLVCASTGNTSASLAAYASHAGMTAAVVLPSGNVAAGKLTQAVFFGAKILKVQGTFDRALKLLLQVVSSNKGLYLVNSVNPYRVEGQKTVAFEIFEQLGGRVPHWVVLPVGNAGNISAVWKGFNEMRAWGITRQVPRMIGVQAKGAAPIAEAFERGSDRVTPLSSPETIASAIKIGSPVSWMKAFKAIEESKGSALAVTDREIIQARKAIASKEGIFVEAASAAAVAALKHLKGEVGSDQTIVCIATGSGLKEQDSVSQQLEEATTVTDGRSLAKELLR